MIRTTGKRTISNRTASAKKVLSAMDDMLDCRRMEEEKMLGILGMFRVGM